MIEKICSIKNVGRFCNYSAAGDVSFRKLTLIYAENGRGKTTLCAILRSLQSGLPEFIMERKTLAVNDPASVHLRMYSGSFQFSNGTWNSTYPSIAIFDSVFIHENVYSGDYVEHEHKKNLYRVVVGPQGVALARQVDELGAKIRVANEEIRTRRDAVMRHLPRGISFEIFLRMSPVEDVDEKIRHKSEEIANRQRAIEKAAEIRNKRLLNSIQLPSLPDDFATVLRRQIENISADAETRVREHIARCMDRQGEPWLEHGLGYIKDEQCPFCGQDISAIEIIAAYRSYFNTEYKNLKAEIAQLEHRLNNAIGESSLNILQQTLSGNLTLAEFWRQFVEITIPEFPLEAIKGAFSRLRSECAMLIQRKQSNPLEIVIPGDNFNEAVGEIEKYRQSIDAYNAAVISCNEKINQLKTSVSQNDELAQLQQELSALAAAKRRFESEVVQACQDYENASETKRQLDEQKKNAKDQLDQYCETILQSYEQSINDYLDQFNTGFRIINTRHLYTGGTPSSQFQIAINDTPVDLGDSRTPAGTHCFKTTLSSGDRSALALAFFLAVLKQDQQLADKIVVLDDPFTSLDRFRRTCTQQLIHQLCNRAQQVIVLSHDPQFLKLLWDGCSANEVKALQMSKAGETTVIGEWDIIAATQSEYLKDYSTLLAFYRERKGDARAVARAIRPFLESMLRSRFPGHFSSNEWLGDFIVKIRDSDPGSGLQQAKADLSELEAINDYSKKYHHDQNRSADTVIISEDELHGFVKRTLRLVGGP